MTNTGKREQSATFTAGTHWGNTNLTAHHSYFDQELGILRGPGTENIATY
ncbi:MAG: hypothetical protein ACFB15_23190 [Cyclobacteriaceae bacterium]